jgi:hypothetical protein
MLRVRLCTARVGMTLRPRRTDRTSRSTEGEDDESRNVRFTVRSRKWKCECLAAQGHYLSYCLVHLLLVPVFCSLVHLLFCFLVCRFPLVRP